MNNIEQLYYGNIQPNDGKLIEGGYKKADILRCSHYHQLTELLSEEQKEMLDKLCEDMSNMESEFGKYMFETGFSLGVRLTAESFFNQ